jgi:DNA-directed RNA polymerase subunit alpha
MFPINQFKISKKSEGKNQAVFALAPLPKGYANTLGTVLRRILLSSIPGAAVTAVKFENVQHEYTTLAGLKDDLLTIVLSLKDLAVVSHSDEPVELELTVKGKKGEATTVTAANIGANPMVEILNPELVITTLADEKTEIKARIVVEKGIGYRMADDSKRNEVGTIPVDSIFSPVKLVSIQSLNTRVGQQTDLDELEIHIVTDGSVKPEAALHQSAEILQTMSAHMVDNTLSLLDAKLADRMNKADLPIAKERVEVKKKVAPILVADLNLSTRLTNALLNSDYEDLRQLDGLTEEEVRNIKGMGEKSYNELLEILQDNDLTLI